MNIIRNNVDNTWNDESTQKVVNIYRYIITFEFVITLVIVSRCLEVTRPLTKQLQTASYDAGAARNKVSLFYVMLEKKSTETEPVKPGTVSRQVYRDNVPANSPSEYFRRSVSVPFLDHLIGHINSRFSLSNLDVMDALYGSLVTLYQM